MTKRTEGMDDAVIRDPAHAAAAGKCWLSRRMGGMLGSVVADHPDECAWCEFEPEFIIDRLEEFNEWAGLTQYDRMDVGDPLTKPLRAGVEGFMMLSAEEQKRLVRAAQGFDSAPLQPITEEPDRLSDIYR